VQSRGRFRFSIYTVAEQQQVITIVRQEYSWLNDNGAAYYLGLAINKYADETRGTEREGCAQVGRR
jgi:hypothetical protein